MERKKILVLVALASLLFSCALRKAEWKVSECLIMRYVPVPAGGITFPSKRDDSELVTVVKPFWVEDTEVTWKLWDMVLDWHSHNSRGYYWGKGQMGGWFFSKYYSNFCDANHPVTMVSWRDAIVFCNALTEWVNETQSPSTPLVPVYYSDAAYTQPIKETDTGELLHTNAGEIDKPYIKADTNGNTDMANCSANGFRLPTSAEWECAARWQGKTNLNDNFVDPLPSGCTPGYYWTKGDSASGSKTAYDCSDTTHVSVYRNNSIKKTASVKTKRANGLGLYDVSGSVWEWSFGCPPEDSSSRILYGGSWSHSSYSLQVGNCVFYSPNDRSSSYGLRVFSNR